MSKNCEKCLSQLPETPGDILKHKASQFTMIQSTEKYKILTSEKLGAFAFMIKNITRTINLQSSCSNYFSYQLTNQLIVSALVMCCHRYLQS